MQLAAYIPDQSHLPDPERNIQLLLKHRKISSVLSNVTTQPTGKQNGLNMIQKAR
jgi:hypothetical protein